MEEWYVMNDGFVQITKRLYELVLKFSLANTDYIDQAILDQIRRSSSSILLNYCEGIGYKSKNQFYKFLRISRGSAFETKAAMSLVPGLSHLMYVIDGICRFTAYDSLTFQDTNAVKGKIDPLFD
jgi:four helix bundle protein